MNNDVEIMMSNIELTYIKVDDVVTSSNDFTFDESEYPVKMLRDVNNQNVEFEEIILKQPQLLLLSGIAGFRKTRFFKKCLYCWATGKLWKNVDFVLYFKFKKLNDLNHVSNPQEMVNKFYKNILDAQYLLSSQLTVMFIIDGLDEFVHLEHLYSYLSRDCSNIHIVSTLMNILSATNIKCVLGGRVDAVKKYQSLAKGHKNILHIQIMGFSNIRIKKYGDNYKVLPKTDLQIKEFEQHIDYLKHRYRHIPRRPLKEIYQYFKQHILNICSAAFNMLDEGRSIVSEAEQALVLKNGIDPLGFIVKSNANQHYKFVKPLLMNFCASVHLFHYPSLQRVFNHERLRSCLPAACGLLNTKIDFLGLFYQLPEHFPSIKTIWLRYIIGKQNISLDLR